MPMSKQKTGLVPELRFPEFVGETEWYCDRFDKIYEFKSTNSLSRDKLNYNGGTVKNIHYGDIHTKFSTLFDITSENVPYVNDSKFLEKLKPEAYCRETDIIFADASEDMEDIGKSIEIININNEKLISGLHTLLARQKNQKLIKGFGGYLFKSTAIRTQIQKEAQGAKVLGITTGRIASIKVSYPYDEKEQQKIADCLSSIDELITAHTQKLNALKTHKKGLLQQLFPADGENVPKLRFPEFRDKGEWEKKILSNLCDMQAGKFVKASEIQNRKEEKFYPCYGGNGLRGFTKSYTHEGAYSLIGRQGALCGNITLAEGKFHATEHAVVVTPKKGVRTDWLYFMLIHLDLNKYATGQAQPGLSVENLNNVELRFTPIKTEQKEIASLLSTTLELINAQTYNIEILKDHKKGLMQRLFPIIDKAMT